MSWSHSLEIPLFSDFIKFVIYHAVPLSSAQLHDCYPRNNYDETFFDAPLRSPAGSAGLCSLVSIHFANKLPIILWWGGLAYVYLHLLFWLVLCFGRYYIYIPLGYFIYYLICYLYSEINHIQVITLKAKWIKSIRVQSSDVARPQAVSQAKPSRANIEGFGPA